MKNEKPVLIVGSIALDTIEIGSQRRDDIVGGSTTYALLAAGRDVPVSIVGVIGDNFPATAHELYQQYAANLTDLQIVAGPTFRWGGHYHANGDDRTTLFTELGVFADFNPVLSPENKQVPLVFLANIHPGLQLRVIEQCHPEALIVTDTMNLWIDTTPELLNQVLAKTDILLINETEAQSLAGTAALAAAAGKLQSFGPPVVVIKQGSKGASLFHENNRLDIGVFPIDAVVDPTGAGDTFGGGFIAALALGGDYRAAMVRGSALASFAVEGFGVERLQAAGADELLHRIDYLDRLVSS